MGQYHAIANLDKRKGWGGHDLALGTKFLELAESQASCAALLVMLAGNWSGDRIALIGDYAEDSDLTPQGDDVPAKSLYSAVVGEKEGYQATSAVEEVRAALGERDLIVPGYRNVHPVFGVEEFLLLDTWATEGESMVLVNFDKKQRVDPAQLGDNTDLNSLVMGGWYGGTGTAAYVLLAASAGDGGRGGGDPRIDKGGLPRRCPGGRIVAGDRIGLVPVSAETDKMTDISWEVRELLAAAESGVYEVTDYAVRRLTWEEQDMRG